MYIRRKTNAIKVGNMTIGGDAPIRIQTMANTDTNDIEASVAQALRCIEAGTELLRYTTQGVRETESLRQIKAGLRAQGIELPLVADIHFNPNVAEAAARYVEKVRINPGNFVKGHNGEYTDEEWKNEVEEIRLKLRPLLAICRQNGTAIRIGVNHGSLSPRIMSRYGNTPEGLAASCMEFIGLCQQEGFTNLILSVKASNTMVMIHAVRLLVQMMDQKGLRYPLHLGVTEAGSDMEGRIKSAVGIGTLLHDGIGDTIRVSLSEAPEAEIPVARRLADYIASQYQSDNNRIDLIDSLSTAFSHRKTDNVGIFGGDNVVRVVGNKTSNGDLKADTLFNDIPQGVHLLAPATGKTLMADVRTTIRSAKDTEGDTKPFVVSFNYPAVSLEELQIRAAADFGPLLIDNLIDGINIQTENPDITEEQLTESAYAILQAAGARVSRTEYISCPSCGRTKFNLPEAVRRVKKATAQYAGLKIAVMGCIVNGPGEMADADYGYIGAGAGRVSLYHKAQCVEKNIPENEAIDRLIHLIETTKRS